MAGTLGRGKRLELRRCLVDVGYGLRRAAGRRGREARNLRRDTRNSHVSTLPLRLVVGNRNDAHREISGRTLPYHALTDAVIEQRLRQG